MVSHQTLLHPMVTLHGSRPPQHSHHQKSRQHQQRPDSPSSLEDLSESGADTLSVDSTESRDYPDSSCALDTTDPNIKLNRDLGLLSSGIDSATPASDTCGKSESSLNFSDKAQDRSGICRTAAPSLMMATPPLSPTRHQFFKEPAEERDVMPLRRSEERKKNPAARVRAGSAPPTAGGRLSRGTSSIAPGEVPPVPPVPHIPGQPTSAWTALLPGVAPIRVNPRPTVKTSTRSAASNSHTEQRVHQQVPIMLPPERESLLPTEESHQRRTRLVSKIERIIHTEWPGQDIKVLPFGSTVNDLGTNSSDVDICILTSWLGLQGVEMLADVFRKHGMENLFCVPEAKVPIVKLWDPELQLSCDMNINTQLGIMNSRMVKTYVAIDPRVRPFAMIIKHWAKKRVLNDAASGGTISTYTWICMVINFLQMRSPPILPSLHDMEHELSPDNQVINGNNTSFFSDLSKLEGFGQANKESLGGLLYAFFRKFAIEFDYDHHVISIRHACYLTKESKDWHIPGKHYRLLCVEEPFDTTRNLGNSCDMASGKGLKQEFRRALDILNHGGGLDQVCEQWVPPYYYHNNKSGSNGGFLSNNQAAGRRYGNGYRSQRHGSSSRSEGGSRSEDSAKHTEHSRHSRPANNSCSANSRPERTGHDKRPRSSSATYLRDTGSTLTSAHAMDSYKDIRKGLESKTTKDFAIESTIENTVVLEGPSHNRPRKASIHGRDDSVKPTLPLGKQSAKNGAPKSLPLPPSPTRPKSSTKGHGGDGHKGHGGQKNNRSTGATRDGSHGGKVPRATVELCLADIAKIVNKSDLPQLLSTNVEADGIDCKRKASGKKNLLWSTNSNRGESRGSHPSSRQQDGVEQPKARLVAVPGEFDEAGPRVDVAGVASS
ncbi:hypothetical protein BGZ80_009354 [Entomortierella chlamydospora]|uniref:polynucleotide adenylyltransferase n=1 Tax=Entomortierella chlamydospora TaxID=101097 RepID=A0A9P6MWD7_9FUNG|nr:hypothetical protein BGZ80_009354 [Entomortierella chlamydospora]